MQVPLRRDLTDGRLLLQMLGAKDIGISSPRFVVSCLASSNWLPWTYLPLASAPTSTDSTPPPFISPPGTAENSWTVDSTDARGRPPLLLIQVYDHVRGGDAVGSTALDFSILLEPPHTRELMLPVEMASRKPGGAIYVRASFLPIFQPTVQGDPYPSVSTESPYRSEPPLLHRIGSPTTAPLRRVSAATDGAPQEAPCVSMSDMSSACYLPFSCFRGVLTDTGEAPPPLPLSAPASPRRPICFGGDRAQPGPYPAGT